MLASAVHQHESAIGIHMFPLSWTSLPPLTLSYPFGLSQTPSLSHTTNSHWLSILHTVGWDGWMASLTRWTWAWVKSGSWWWTGRPGVLRFMGSQRVGHAWVTELNWTELREVIKGMLLQINPWLRPRKKDTPHSLPCPWNLCSAWLSHSQKLHKGHNLDIKMWYLD